MPNIQSNRYYNDPRLGAAFESLASVFAPPSGSDMAGYAAAKAKKEEAARLAEVFNYAHSPEYSRDMADRLGIGAGVFTPNQSWGAVELGDQTARRGQDLTSSTTLKTNAADNERALATNAADNARALDQTRLTNTKDITTSMLVPVTQGATRFVPTSIADMFGTPETQVGAINAGQGETIVTPDGRTVTGAPKPLSETEWKAAQNERLRANGKLTDDTLLSAILGDKAPVQAIGPGGKPQYMSPGDAVRANAEPYNPSADKSLVEGTTVINGKSVQVFRKPSDSSYYTADGKPVPPDVQVYDKAKPTGTNEQLGMKPTEFTTKNGMFGVRADAANATMNELMKNGYSPTAIDFEMAAGVGQKNLPASFSNYSVSSEGKQYFNAAQNFVMSIARPDTGAAISNQEMDNFFKIYIPLPSDPPEVVENKRKARELATSALYANSAGAADQTIKYIEANGFAIPDEMRARLDRVRQGSSLPHDGSTSAPASGAADPLAAARAAIAKGAPREKVIERLRQNGINPEGL